MDGDTMTKFKVTARSEPRGYPAKVWHEHDGDTFTALVDVGFGGAALPPLRLDGVHAPEIHPLQPGGQETTSFVNNWLATAAALADPSWTFPLWVETIMETGTQPGQEMTFTRYVATVWRYVDMDPAGYEYADSLNCAANTFLAGHPEWPTGD